MDVSQSAIIFITLLVGLSTIAYLYKSPHNEGFQSTKLKQPTQPPPMFITGAGPQPVSEKGTLPGAPFGTIAASSPLPYKDPVQEKASLFQINSLLADLRGFLGFEAQQLEERSDPTIQLPLTRAKADFQRLTDEFHVLSATPGIQSQLTQKDILSIRSNLRYLQRESRQITATATGTRATIREGFEDSGPRATRAELNEVVIKIYAEMQRLSVSGTSDPVVQARLTALTNMRLDIQALLEKLDSGNMTPEDIPIYKSDIDKLLPLLTNLNEPLPTILQSAGLSPVLANLLPVKDGSKESDYLADNQDAISAALDKLVKGLSWSVALEYTSENKAAAGRTAAQEPFNPNDQSLFSTGFPSPSEMATVSNPMGTAFSPTSHSGISNYPMSLEEQRMDALSAVLVPTKPGHFDWKERAKNIRESIRKRGLTPSDFGCMTPAQEASVSPDFSWRGYCKMVCNRLSTTMDPGLPETCGCPPQGWMGWSK